MKSAGRIVRLLAAASLIGAIGCSGVSVRAVWIDADQDGAPERIELHYRRTGDIAAGALLETPDGLNLLLESQSADYASARWSAAAAEIAKSLEPMLLKFLEAAAAAP